MRGFFCLLFIVAAINRRQNFPEIIFVSFSFLRWKEKETKQRKRNTRTKCQTYQGCLGLLAVRKSVIPLTKRAGWLSATRRTCQNLLCPEPWASAYVSGFNKYIVTRCNSISQKKAIIVNGFSLYMYQGYFTGIYYIKGYFRLFKRYMTFKDVDLMNIWMKSISG